MQLSGVCIRCAKEVRYSGNSGNNNTRQCHDFFHHVFLEEVLHVYIHASSFSSDGRECARKLMAVTTTSASRVRARRRSGMGAGGGNGDGDGDGDGDGQWQWQW